jgi:hypothetical protein
MIDSLSYIDLITDEELMRAELERRCGRLLRAAAAFPAVSTAVEQSCGRNSFLQQNVRNAYYGIAMTDSDSWIVHLSWPDGSGSI